MLHDDDFPISLMDASKDDLNVRLARNTRRMEELKSKRQFLDRFLYMQILLLFLAIGVSFNASSSVSTIFVQSARVLAVVLALSVPIAWFFIHRTEQALNDHELVHCQIHIELCRRERIAALLGSKTVG